MSDQRFLYSDCPRPVADAEGRIINLFKQEARNRAAAVDLPYTGSASFESELAGLAGDKRNVIRHMPVFDAEFQSMTSFDPGQQVVASNRRSRPTVLFRRSLVSPVSVK